MDKDEHDEYVMPAWEQAAYEQAAAEAREQVQYTLRHLEHQEGRMVPTPGALCDRKYRLPCL